MVNTVNREAVLASTGKFVIMVHQLGFYVTSRSGNLTHDEYVSADLYCPLHLITENIIAVDDLRILNTLGAYSVISKQRTIF